MDLDLIVWMCGGIVGVACLLVGIFWIWRWRRQPAGPPVPRGSALEWCCAMSAILSDQNFCPWNTLAFSTPAVCRESLGRWWDCFCREDVLDVLDGLVSRGHGSGFLAALAAVRAADPPRDDWEARVQAEAKRIAVRHDHIRAWDLCRAVFVARSAHAAGWLSREETEQWLLALGRELQAGHRSWSDAMMRYCDGREFWVVYNQMDPTKVGDVRWLAERLLKRKGSAFNRVEWDRDLG
ncbi:MAG: DUF1266 domain-containing protein [Deltaproteobacteria bacterium]|nr:DUF1266 domain-containing protein [Deltaproteobacteria bacterium]